MSKTIFQKGISFGIAWAIVFITLTCASGEDQIRLQGYLMKINFEKKLMMVNEGVFAWDENTVINNHEGSPIPIEKIKPKSWVYIVGENGQGHKQIVIKRIYHLPKHIDKKARNRYPFMQ